MLRAERRVGQLLAEMTRATPQTRNIQGSNQHEDSRHDVGNPQSEFAEALTKNNISRQTAHRYQALG